MDVKINLYHEEHEGGTLWFFLRAICLSILCCGKNLQRGLAKRPEVIGAFLKSLKGSVPNNSGLTQTPKSANVFPLDTSFKTVLCSYIDLQERVLFCWVRSLCGGTPFILLKGIF